MFVSCVSSSKQGSDINLLFHKAEEETAVSLSGPVNPVTLSSLAAEAGEHGGGRGGVLAGRTGGFRHPLPRRVPVVRKTEGAQRPEPDGATGTHVSAAPSVCDVSSRRRVLLLQAEAGREVQF